MWLIILVALSGWHIAKLADFAIELSVSAAISFTHLSACIARISRKAIVVGFTPRLASIICAAILLDVTVIRSQTVYISTFIFEAQLTISTLRRVRTSSTLFSSLLLFGTSQKRKQCQHHWHAAI